MTTLDDVQAWLSKADSDHPGRDLLNTNEWFWACATIGAATDTSCPSCVITMNAYRWLRELCALLEAAQAERAMLHGEYLKLKTEHGLLQMETPRTLVSIGPSLQAAAAAERGQVVAWLRQHAESGELCDPLVMAALADMIEARGHWAEEP